MGAPGGVRSKGFAHRTLLFVPGTSPRQLARSGLADGVSSADLYTPAPASEHTEETSGWNHAVPGGLGSPLRKCSCPTVSSGG